MKYEGRLCFDMSLCVCPHLWGGTPSEVWWWGGYPIPGLAGGYPIPGLARGVPHPRSDQRGTQSQVWPGGYSISGWGGGTHSQVGGYPRYPLTRSGWVGTQGVPHPDLRWGTPYLDLEWGTPYLDLGQGTPLPRPEMGYPLPEMGYPPYLRMKLPPLGIKLTTYHHWFGKLMSIQL